MEKPHVVLTSGLVKCFITLKDGKRSRISARLLTVRDLVNERFRIKIAIKFSFIRRYLELLVKEAKVTIAVFVGISTPGARIPNIAEARAEARAVPLRI